MRNYIREKDVAEISQSTIYSRGKSEYHCIVCNKPSGYSFYLPICMGLQVEKDYLVVCSDFCREIYKTNPLAYPRRSTVESRDKTNIIITAIIAAAVTVVSLGIIYYCIHANNQVQEAIKSGVDPMRAYCAYNTASANCSVLFYRKGK
jgi:predicted nucleic acid-binding Zn ribbon protein